MIEVDFENQEEMCKWASIQSGGISFEPCQAIGFRKDGFLICVVLYNNYSSNIKTGEPIMTEMSIYSIDKSWCNRHNLNILFAYPFIQLKVKRVQASISKKNKHARNFVERLGFVYEGCQRQGWIFGGDCVVYSMLKHECKWL